MTRPLGARGESQTASRPDLLRPLCVAEPRSTHGIPAARRLDLTENLWASLAEHFHHGLLALLALVALLAVPSASAGEVPQATLILEASVGVPGTLPAAAPPRFVLRRDGSVFVGGSEQIYAGLLAKDEVKLIERRVKALRQAGVLGPSVSFGDDTTKSYRLRVLKDGARDVVITGDPAAAPPELQGLALLVSDLLRFDHPSLRPWAPTEYAVSAREGVLVGGCREWLLPLSLDEVLDGPRRLAADEVERWPAGADPASVCRDGRRYVVTLRPLLPGEQP